MTTTTVRPGALTALLGELARAPEATGWAVPLVPGEAVGRFEIVREIGRGGFGVVYEARDTELGRSVAFKAIRAGSTDAARELRTLAEAEAAARLAHPNIVHLYDVGRSERGAFLIMELLHGESLHDRLARGPPLKLRDAVGLAVEISRGLAHAHEQGVVHRDLKPGNVFLCDDGQVKVLDFGLAHVFGQGGMSGGTPEYMAPEQARGEPSDERADVYALGVILHELVTGTRPAAPGSSLLSPRTTSSPLPPRTTSSSLPPRIASSPLPPRQRGERDQGRGGIPRRVPASLTRLVSHLLAPDPADRPGNAAQIHAQLASIQKSLEPRRLLWAAVAVSAAAILGAGLFAWLWQRPLPPGRLLVAMADVANSTGDPDLDGLSEIIRTALTQSNRVSLLARSRVLATLERLGIRGEARIDERLARRVARDSRAQALLIPAVRRDAAGYELEVRVVDLARDEPVFTVRERTAGKGAVRDALDRLADGVRRELGDDPNAGAVPPVRLAQVFPANPEIWRLWDEAKRLDADARPEEARAVVLRILEVDPEFPLAHAQLAGDLLWRDQAASERHLEIALRNLDRIPPMKRLLLEARSAVHDFRFLDAIAIWERVIAGWPQEPAAYLRSAFVIRSFLSDAARARPYLEKALELAKLREDDAVDVLVALGRLDEALTRARRAAEASPSRGAFRLLAFAHRARGEPREALEATRRAASFGEPALGAEVFWTYVEADALDALEEEYRAALAPARERSALRDFRWQLLALRGRRREGLAALDALAVEAPARAAGVFHALRSAYVWGDGDASRVWREVEAQLVLGSSTAVCSANSLVALGDLGHASRLVGLWTDRDSWVSYCMRLYRHARDWKTGEPEKAVAGLAEMYGPEAAFYRGVILAELGRHREAIEAFRTFRRLPEWNFDGGNVFAYPRSLYLEAAALERLGEREEALAAVDRLLRMWRRADPEIPTLREAKALHARLAATSPR